MLSLHPYYYKLGASYRGQESYNIILGWALELPKPLETQENKETPIISRQETGYFSEGAGILHSYEACEE